MKKAIVFYLDSKNIGDDIQSLAAYTLLDDKDVIFLDREGLNRVNDEEKIKLLCSGWFMHEPNNWPPSDSIIPYFISFHVAKYHHVRNKMLSDKLINYYKQFESIGCRDFKTEKLFKSIGIKSYYSSCLTLTLPTYDLKRNDKIIIVDLFMNNTLSGAYAKKVVYKPVVHY